MFRRYIFIAIENFNRELAGKELLAKELSNKGYVVFLGHKSLIRSLLNLYPLKDHIFIDKGVTKGSSKRISEYKKSGMNVYSFDEEALMQTDTLNYSSYNHEINTIKNIDGIFCWGEKHNQMLKEIGYQNSQLINTGNPRFDCYKNMDKKVFKRNKKKYILICSRFCMIRVSEMMSFDEEFTKPTQEIYRELLNIPRFIRNAGINTPILIRPHPSEPNNLWEEETKDLKNIKISKKGPLKNILSESKMMIHNRCTTGLEAYISEVPVISFEPFKLKEPPHPPAELINEFSDYIVNSKENLISKIKIILKEKKLSSLKKNDNNKYLFYPNELNHIKIAEFIANKYSVEMNNSKKINILKIITLMSFLYFYHSILKILLFFFNNKKFIYIKNKRGKFFNDYNTKKIVRNNFKIRFCSIDIYLPR